MVGFDCRRQIVVAGVGYSILILSVVPTPYDAVPSAPEPLLLVLRTVATVVKDNGDDTYDVINGFDEMVRTIVEGALMRSVPVVSHCHYSE